MRCICSNGMINRFELGIIDLCLVKNKDAAPLGLNGAISSGVLQRCRPAGAI
ncbi:hypothetical protein DSECCO2_98370 [anaerobic digester metagenome]